MVAGLRWDMLTELKRSKDVAFLKVRIMLLGLFSNASDDCLTSG